MGYYSPKQFTRMQDFKKTLLAGTLWKLCYVVSSFLFNAVTVNYLGAPLSGKFYYILNNLFFVNLFLGLGLESGISYFKTRNEININSLFGFSLLWSIGSTVFFAILLYTMPFLNVNIDISKNILTLVFISTGLITTFTSAFFYTSHEHKTPNLISTLINSVLIVIVLYNKFMHGVLSMQTLLKLYFLINIAGALAMLLFIKKSSILSGISYRIGPKFKELATYSFYAFMLSLAFALLRRSDYWMVEKICLPNELGNYIQSTKIIQLLLLLPSLGGFALFPLITESIQQQREAENKVVQLVAVYALAAIVISIPIILLGHWVFPFIYGSSFGAMYSTMILLLPGMILFAAASPLTIYFSGKNKNHINIKGLIISTGTMIALDFLLIPKFSIHGAALSNTIANSLYFIYLIISFMKFNQLTVKAIIAKINFEKNISSVMKFAYPWKK